jgi:hypothetical protein
VATGSPWIRKESSSVAASPKPTSQTQFAWQLLRRGPDLLASPQGSLQLFAKHLAQNLVLPEPPFVCCRDVNDRLIL